MTDSVLVLEITGVLLLMALIGATYIAKKDE
jgi:NADH:ubiquinone oxidoreductase subunit 6 (subunit J)